MDTPEVGEILWTIDGNRYSNGYLIEYDYAPKAELLDGSKYEFEYAWTYSKVELTSGNVADPVTFSRTSNIGAEIEFTDDGYLAMNLHQWTDSDLSSTLGSISYDYTYWQESPTEVYKLDGSNAWNYRCNHASIPPRARRRIGRR